MRELSCSSSLAFTPLRGHRGMGIVKYEYEHGSQTWVQIVAFDSDMRPHNFSFRMTKKGRVNLRDVNRCLRGTDMKVPLKYTDAGMKCLNPDVGWPEDVRMEGIPEFYGHLSVEGLKSLEKTMREHLDWEDEW